MKKLIFLVFILLIATPAVFLSAGELEMLQFSLTIKDLNEFSASELDKIQEENQWLLLDGSLASITALSGKNEEYLLDALLVQGEWIGLDDVKKYSCHLIFEGDHWRDIIPERAPRKPVEGQILLNSRVLILAQISSYRKEGDSYIPYLKVYKIRLLP